MKYIEKTLSNDETIVKSFHPWYKDEMAGILITALICLIGGSYFYSMAGLLLFIYLIFYIKYIEMAITNQRVVYKSGIIITSTMELNMKKIESVSVQQGIWGRIFNYGHIIFSGTGTTKVVFFRVKDPFNTRKQIEEIINK